MDKLSRVAPQQMECISIKDLVPWQKTVEDPDVKSLESSSDSQSFDDLEYAFDEKLNSKIYFWNGDITKLSVQAVILPVYDVLSKSSILARNLAFSAGPRLIHDVRMLSELRTSEVRCLPGYDLPARFAIHTVEPRYNPKFYSAADTALHICYRSALQVCAEKDVKTVAISPIHITRKGFPLLEGCNIALRTVRKCLEMLPKFDAVVIVTDPTVVEMYARFFPVYFPRSLDESLSHARFIPKSIVCNEWGELLFQERAIRVTDVNEATLENEEKEAKEDESEVTIDQKAASQTFAQMSGDHDKKRRFMMLYNTNRQSLQSQKRIYQRLLRISRNENFSKFSSLKAVKVSGRDVTGSRVIVIIGRHLIFPEIDLEKFLLYLILTFDPVVNEPYTVVYFHTQTQEFNRPTSDYLRKLYNTFDQRYRSNLSKLCMVHTKTLTKIVTWLFTSFSASDVRSKIVNIRTIPDLYRIVPPNQIDIPPFILTHDMKTNPQAYNSSPSTSPTNTYRQQLVRKPDFNQIAQGSL